MNLLRTLQGSLRSAPPISLEEWVSWFSYNGLNYPVGLKQSLGSSREEIEQNFEGFVQGIYKRNGVVFACMLVRQLLFSEARFQFRRLSSGRPGDLFGDRSLRPLERPWTGGTTGDLLGRTIQDGDLAGNFFAALRRDRIRRMRPDWVAIVLGTMATPDKVAEAKGSDLDAEVIGYIYQPGGAGSAEEPVPLLPEEVVHFAPIPDPLANYRGMSWLTPVLREITGDSLATTHKVKFFENAATPNLVVNLTAVTDQQAFDKWIEVFEKQHKGALNAYKTLFLAGGADPKVIGSDFQQMDFKNTQGAGETRIAAAAGVPPVIVGLSEGLQAATYSNYSQARRRFADGTMRPLWRNAAGSFATIIKVPEGAELWYDDRDIPFLQEDQKDAAEIQGLKSRTIRTLIDAGFKADSVIAAVNSGDFAKLEHSGLFSVQLQPAGTAPSAGDDAGRALAALLAPHLPPKENAE